MKHSKIVRWLFSIFLILLGTALLWICLKMPAPTIDFGKLEETPEYVLTDMYSPVVNYDSTIFYPTVQTIPSGLKYGVVILKEQIDLYQKNRDELFYAAKRIAEVKEWRNNLKILNVVNFDDSESPLNQLKYWWVNDPENKSILSSNYPTWETSLMRYYNHFNTYTQTDEQLNKKNRFIKTNELNKRLIADHAIAQSAVNDSITLPEREKLYLTELLDSFFLELHKEIGTNPSFDPTHLIFNLSELHKDRSYGQYEVVVKIPLQQKDIPLSLTFENNSYYPVRSINTFSTKDHTLLFPNLTIGPKSKEFTVELPQSKPLTISEWKETIIEKDHAYVATISDYDKNEPYLVYLNYHISQPSDLIIEQIESTGSATLKTHLVLNEPLLTTHGSRKIQKLIWFPEDSKKFTARIIVKTPQNFADTDFTLSDLSFIRYINPQISITMLDSAELYKPVIMEEKILKGYKLTVANTNAVQNSFVNFSFGFPWQVTNKTHITSTAYTMAIANQLFYVSLLLISVGFFSLLASLMARNSISVSARNSLFKIKIILHKGGRIFSSVILEKIVVRLRFVFFLLTISGLSFAIVSLSKTTDIIIYLVILGVVVFYTGYRPQSSLNFLVSSAFFLFAILSLVFQHFTLADQFFLWTYIFVIIGIFHSVFEHAVQPKQTITDSEFFEEIIHSTIYKFIKSLLLKSSHLLNKTVQTLRLKGMTFFTTYFGQAPRTFRDYTIATIKLFILVVMAGICLRGLIITAQFSHRVIVKELDRLDLERQKAVIKKTEPTIVYHATRVLIHGIKFEWKENSSVRLMRGKEEVHTDLWNSSKLIFTVPLHWPVGETELVVAKDVFRKGQKITVTSKPILLKILPRGSTMTSDDDSYFEQLKHLSDEALELNGYETREDKKK